MSTTETEYKKKSRQIPEEIVTEGNLNLVEEPFADEELRESVSEIRAAFSSRDVTAEEGIAEDGQFIKSWRQTDVIGAMQQLGVTHGENQ